MKSGYCIVYKPKDVSSFGCLHQVQKKLSQDLKIKKVKMGHAGTLDPLAEGVLLCAIGEGTKMLSHLLLNDKKYIATLFLGLQSTTDDDEGKKTELKNKRNDIPTKSEIEEILKKFIGNIKQTPPVYSALKIDGKRACDRVRNGESVEIKSRQVDIFSITLLEYSYPFLSIEVHCGTGTYIRSLARDIGEVLHIGAYLSFLQRTQVGNFSLADSISPESVSIKNIQSFRAEHFKLSETIVSHSEYADLCQGKFIDLVNMPENSEKNVLVNTEKNVLGLASITDGQLRPKSMMQNII